VQRPRGGLHAGLELERHAVAGHAEAGLVRPRADEGAGRTPGSSSNVTCELLPPYWY
jgi:hypothetical protein